MPLALDPNETFDLVLETDREKPDPPAFVFRYMTEREFLAHAAIGDDDELRSGLSSAEAMDRVHAALAANLVGWRNLRSREGEPIPFAPQRLPDLLTVGEMWELYYGARRQNRVEDDEKNASGSQSPTPTDASAATAQGGTDAPTP